MLSGSRTSNLRQGRIAAPSSFGKERKNKTKDKKLKKKKKGKRVALKYKEPGGLARGITRGSISLFLSLFMLLVYFLLDRGSINERQNG